MRNAGQAARAWGLDPMYGVRRLRALKSMHRERRLLESQAAASRSGMAFPFGPARYIWDEGSDEAGQASGHYFHQDLWVARKVFESCPRKHVDVGSSIYGFVSHVASFREIEVLDIRPVSSQVKGIHFVQQDIMNLDSTYESYCDSLSCLHALEHFGLGRYGDELDIDGWLRGLEALGQMVELGGRLYLGVPTGSTQRIEFNAHRVFSLPYLRDVLINSFDLVDLAFVLDSGALVEAIDPWGSDAARSFDATYGCSIWALEKRA